MYELDWEVKCSTLGRETEDGMARVLTIGVATVYRLSFVLNLSKTSIRTCRCTTRES